jgi:integrating conjugative element protein (TIGR03755 family)
LFNQDQLITGFFLAQNFMFEVAMKAQLFVSLFILSNLAHASDMIPLGDQDNALYYKIGGGDNYSLPPVASTQEMNLDAGADLGSGYSCGAFNPVKSISNTFKNFAGSANNVSQTIIANMQGSIAEIPMYLIAQADPSLYNLINNALLGAHNQLAVSSKACNQVKQEISQGKNPYQDWATISVNNQWKKHLSLTASGVEDINEAKKDIDSHSGDDGVPWVQGKKTDEGTYAGGKNQPPVHVVSDTVKAGFNALLNRDLTSSEPSPKGTELAVNFANPQVAQDWIANVVGDQTITTCTGDASCQSQQSGVAGRGLLPWISSCSLQNQDYCSDNIRKRLGDLVAGAAPLTTDNLNQVSADGVMISPQVIQAIHRMDPTQQSIVVNKLSQQIASQKVMSRALMARHILQAGSQVPIIASNQPAQKILDHTIASLDKEMESLAFESHLRKEMTSDTLSQVLAYNQGQQQTAVTLPTVKSAEPFIQHGAITKERSS